MDDDEIYYDAIELLQQLVATPRVSRHETEAADIVERFMSRHGMSPRRHGNNVWAVDPCFDPSRETLLLNSHLDTVKRVDGWTRDPHDPTIDPETGRLYGLGSNDAGASLVALIGAYRLLVERPERRYNLVLLASAEEEVSGRDGIEAVIPMLPPIDLAIVGEPTGMNPAIAEKGLVVLDGIVEGVAGHAARDEGDNAIYKAVKVVETLRGLEFERESAMLGKVKITVTGIEAGTLHNVVPDRCRLMVDVRTTDAYTNAETVEIISRAVPDCSLTPRSTRLEPSSIAPDHPLVTRAVMMGLEAFGSPTLSDQALMPWPSLKMGPGSSTRSHTADEWIHPDEVRQAIATYVRLIG